MRAIVSLFKAAVWATVWAALVTVVLFGVGSILRDWPAQANRLRSINLGIERELSKLAGR